MLAGYPSGLFAGAVIVGWLVGYLGVKKHDLNLFWVAIPYLILWADNGVPAALGSLLVCGMVQTVVDLVWAVDDHKDG